MNLATTIIAIYGAIVATTTGAFQIYNVLRNRAKLNVKVSAGFLPLGPNPDELKVFIQAVNSGRRPIKLNAAGFTLPNGREIALTGTVNTRLPVKLNERDGHTTWISLDQFKQLLEKAGFDEPPEEAWYKDTTGKKHIAPLPKSWGQSSEAK